MDLGLAGTTTTPMCRAVQRSLDRMPRSSLTGELTAPLAAYLQTVSACNGPVRSFFTGATYRFIAMADDGIRVWVDDALIINGWKDQSRSLYYKDYAVRYGNHTVRVEYYDTRLDASAVVNWAQK